MKTHTNDTSDADFEREMNQVAKEVDALQKRQHEDLTTIEVDDESLNDEGVDVLFSKILNSKSGAATDWNVIGPLIEDHQLSLQFLVDDWDASEEDGVQFVSGSSPCLAIARLMIAKTLCENFSSEYTLRLSFGTAKTLLRDSGEKIGGIITANLLKLDDSELVTLKLLTNSGVR
jgi:hypothetical protein